ncbi:hypothetical protein Vadar_001287 [Vaccinium darrowii]|uniref:Uncharacterized protein n=1 Tax=Vaccinium darrowii TaxID=229202 RepID=A0ACB7XEK5_9ERIC|nr:hypothetical protein Vadar_001287 [Vaccinium darrowii]
MVLAYRYCMGTDGLVFKDKDASVFLGYFFLTLGFEGKNQCLIIPAFSAVIPGVLILLLCLVIIIWRRRKLNVSSYINSKNSSSDLLSKADIEGGSAYFGACVFSYAELEQATHDFDPSKELGDGGCGTVYHGKKGHCSDYNYLQHHEDCVGSYRVFVLPFPPHHPQPLLAATSFHRLPPHPFIPTE